MNSLIQKKLEEAQKLYNRYSNGSVRVVPEAIEAFLTTALQEALIAGLELAEGAVPEMKENFSKVPREEWGHPTGWNKCRAQNLANMTALKKEVMEGRK